MKDDTMLTVTKKVNIAASVVTEIIYYQKPEF